MDEKKMMMRKIGRQISLLMGITMSFFLSLAGILSSGKFRLSGFLLSFLLSTVVSLILGFFLPLKEISDSATVRNGMKPGALSTRVVESCIFDVIYTPLLTLINVGLAYFMATSHGGQMPFVPVLVKSLILCLVAGFVLIFIFQPIFMKLVFKKNGIPFPPEVTGDFSGRKSS